jgi:hypothetical protein
MKTVRIITPTGHLGTTPLEKGSFERGCAASPDFIVADSGSADIGPYPLGADQPASDEVWQRARAAAICHIAGKNLFYAGLPDVKGTAGTAAIMSDEVLRARPAYEWTLNHVIEVKDDRELFRTRFETIRP